MSIPSTGRKVFQVVFAQASCLLTAGIIFGFAALKPVLIREGIYDDLCDSARDRELSRLTGRPCLGQDLQLNLSFTISIVVTNVGALPVGIILDHLGPRYTSLVGAVIFALGNLFLGIDPHGTGIDTFLVGYICLAIGGPMIFLSSFHLCNTFPKRSGLILSSIIGAFDASSLPFVIYAAIYRNNRLPLHTWFWLYMLVPAVIFLEQLTLGPKETFVRKGADGPALVDEQTALLHSPELSPSAAYLGTERPDTLRKRPSVYDSSFSRIHSATDAGGEHAEGYRAQINKDPITGVLWGKSAFSQIGTAWFWLPQLFLICYMLRINYEIATVYDQVLYYTGDDTLAQKITDAFVVLLPLGGVVSIPFIGYILDKRSSMAAFAVLLVLGFGYGVLCMINSAPAQILGIVMFTVMRPLMYTAISDYYTKVIGIETFGTVYGFANALSGAFTLVQYGIDWTVKRKLHGNYTPVNAAFTAVGLALALAVIWKQYAGAWRERLKEDRESAVED